MNIACNWISNLPVLTPRGVLDKAKCGELKKKIINLAGFGEEYIIIDVEHVSFLDSAAFGILSTAVDELKVKNTNLILSGLEKKSNSITKIKKLFDSSFIFDRLDDAVKFLTKNKIYAN